MTTISFSEFNVDVINQTLSRNGKRVPIGNRCFDLLLFLIRHRDRYISTELLRAEVWKSARLTPAAIPTAVRELRRILGDSVRQAKFVESVPRKGYRFIAKPTFNQSSESRTAPASAELRFSGREGELAKLQDSLRATTSRGLGQLAILRGEAGIGKTRLLQKFLDQNKSQRQVFARCKAGHSGDPFSIWIDAALAASTDCHEAIDAIRPIIETLKTPSADGEKNSRSRARKNVFEQWTSIIRQITSRGPIIFAFDDVHLADPDSIFLIAWISDALTQSPIQIIVTQSPWNPSEAHQRAAEDIASVSHAITLELGGLSPEEIESAIDPEDRGISIDSEQLHANTAGNPFLLTQVMQGGVAVRSEGGGGLRSLEISNRAYDITVRTMANIPPKTREILTFASIEEGTLTCETIEVVTQTCPAEITQHLEPALRSGLLIEVGSGYSFRHPVLRDSLSSTLPTWKKKSAHARIAHHYLSRADSPTLTRKIAHHAARSVPLVGHDIAADYCASACIESIKSMDYFQARSFAEITLDLRTSSPNTTVEMHCTSILLLARCNFLLGQRQVAREAILGAAQIAREHKLNSALCECALTLAPDFASIDVGTHDPTLESLIHEALIVAPIEDIGLRATLLARLSMSLMWNSDSIAQENYAREACALSEKSTDNDAKCEALSALSECFHGPERAHERLQIIKNIDKIARPLGFDEQALVRHTRKITAMLELGMTKEIASVNTAYQEIARKSGMPHHIWYSATTDAMLSLLTGNMRLSSDLDRYYSDITRLGTIPNVVQGYAVQKLFRDAECCRYDEILPGLQAVVSAFPLVTGWRAALAWYYWNTKNSDECARHLSFFTPTRIREMMRQAGAGAGLAMLAEASAAYGKESMRRELLKTILPIADRCATAGYGVLYFGTYSRYIGILARSLNKNQIAVELLTRAVEFEASRPADLWHGYSLVDLALAKSQFGCKKTEIEEVVRRAEHISRLIRVPRLDMRVSDMRTAISAVRSPERLKQR